MRLCQFPAYAAVERAQQTATIPFAQPVPAVTTADAQRIQNQEDQPEKDKGRYLRPKLFGHPEDQAVMQRSHPSRNSARLNRPFKLSLSQGEK